MTECNTICLPGASVWRCALLCSYFPSPFNGGQFFLTNTFDFRHSWSTCLSKLVLIEHKPTLMTATCQTVLAGCLFASHCLWILYYLYLLFSDESIPFQSVSSIKLTGKYPCPYQGFWFMPSRLLQCLNLDYPVQMVNIWAKYCIYPPYFT